MNAPKLFYDCLVSRSVCLSVLVIKLVLGVMTRFLSSNCITVHVVVNEYRRSNKGIVVSVHTMKAYGGMIF